MVTFFTVKNKKKKNKDVKYGCLAVWKLLRISWVFGPTDVQTGMRTGLAGLIKKRNVEYLQVKNQLQEEYFIVWPQCLNVSVQRSGIEEEFENGNFHFRVRMSIFKFVVILNKLVLLLFII